MPSAPYTYSGYTGDGEYWIKPVGTGAPFKVTCDMTQDGGGWTLIGKFDGTTDTTLTAAYRVLVPYTQVKMSLNGTTTDKMITCHASAATGFAANNTAGVNCSVPDTDGKLYSVRVLQIGTNGTGNYGYTATRQAGLLPLEAVTGTPVPPMYGAATTTARAQPAPTLVRASSTARRMAEAPTATGCSFAKIAGRVGLRLTPWFQELWGKRCDSVATTSGELSGRRS